MTKFQALNKELEWHLIAKKLKKGVILEAHVDMPARQKSSAFIFIVTLAVALSSLDRAKKFDANSAVT